MTVFFLGLSSSAATCGCFSASPISSFTANPTFFENLDGSACIQHRQSSAMVECRRHIAAACWHFIRCRSCA